MKCKIQKNFFWVSFILCNMFSFDKSVGKIWQGRSKHFSSKLLLIILVIWVPGILGHFIRVRARTCRIIWVSIDNWHLTLNLHSLRMELFQNSECINSQLNLTLAPFLYLLSNLTIRNKRLKNLNSVFINWVAYIYTSLSQMLRWVSFLPY